MLARATELPAQRQGEGGRRGREGALGPGQPAWVPPTAIPPGTMGGVSILPLTYRQTSFLSLFLFRAVGE